MKSLSRQVLLGLGLGILAVMGAWGLAELHEARRQGQAQLLKDQQAIAERLAYNLNDPLWNLDKQDMERTVRYEAVNGVVQALLVYDENGALYLGKVRDPQGLLQDYDPKDPRQSAWLKGPLAPLSQAIQMKGKPIGRVVLYVSDGPLQAQLRALQRAWLLKLTALLAALAAIMVLVLRRTVLGPLHGLVDWAATIGPDRVSPEPPAGLSLEMQALADALMAMDTRMGVKNQQLAASAASYRTLFEGMPVAAFVYDVGTRRFVTANQAAADLLGLPVEDLLGMSVPAFVPAELREAFVERLKAYDRNAESKVVQRIQTHQGRLLDVEVRGRFIELDGHDLRLVMLTDVTQDRAIHEALRKNEERFRTLIEDSSEALLLLDADGKVLYASSSVQAVSGYTPEERVGSRANTVLHPDDRALVRRAFEQSLAEPGQRFSFQSRLLHKRGHYIVTAATLRNRLGDPAIQAVVLNYRDVTAEREAQSSLAASEARFRALIENTQDLVLIYRPDGSLSYENPSAASAVLGYSAAELAAFGAFDLVHPEDLAAALRQAELSLRQPLHQAQLELRLRRRDGSYLSFDARSINLAQNPVVGGILVQLRDISASREAQRQLMRFERLAAIGQTAAGLAHEVRNPLATISARAEYLKLALANDAAVQADLDSVLRQVERLRDMVNQVLESSRVEDLALKDLDAGQVMEAALKAAQKRYGKASEGIAVQRDLGMPVPTLKADAAQLERVLQHLMVNAMQAMGSEGQLSLAARREAGWVLLSVADNGPGVAEAMQPKVFEPFYTTKKTGSGLGLWICKNLVEQHGGKLELESVTPQGCRFTVRLPSDLEAK